MSTGRLLTAMGEQDAEGKKKVASLVEQFETPPPVNPYQFTSLSEVRNQIDVIPDKHKFAKTKGEVEALLFPAVVAARKAKEAAEANEQLNESGFRL